MQQLARMFKFYVFSNIHVALAGFCLTKITLLKFDNFSNTTPLFVALSIVISYNFIRFYEVKTNRLNWMKPWLIEYEKLLMLLVLFAFIGLIYIVFFAHLRVKAMLFLIPFAVVTFFYVFPLFKTKQYEISFRNFPGIKIFSIAVTWSAVTVLFPLYEIELPLNNAVFLEFIQRILFLIVITLPFDIRDVNTDPKELSTIPQAVGIINAKIIGTVLLIFFVVMSFFNQYESKNIIIIALLTGSLLWFSSVKNHRYYSSFWVESIPIWWLLLMVYF